MEPSQFVHLFPRLYHLTFASNLSGIAEHGLHSAHSLADLHRFDSAEREATLVLRRRVIQDLHGVLIRDQHAANEKRMKSCLVGVTIPEWLALLNSKIFFFVEKKKAVKFAESYASYPNVLLEVETTPLLKSHAAHVTLSHVNAGSFIFNARPRGRASFIPLHEFIYRKTRDTPAELTVDTPIPNILDFATVIDLPVTSSAT